MKTKISFLLLSLTLLFAHLSFCQAPELNDKAAIKIGDGLEGIISEAIYLLKLEDGNTVVLAKEDLKKLNKKWISRIDLLTLPEKKKEYGYEGSNALAIVELKQKRIHKYLELIGKKVSFSHLTTFTLKTWLP